MVCGGDLVSRTRRGGSRCHVSDAAGLRSDAAGTEPRRLRSIRERPTYSPSSCRRAGYAAGSGAGPAARSPRWTHRAVRSILDSLWCGRVPRVPLGRCTRPISDALESCWTAGRMDHQVDRRRLSGLSIGIVACSMTLFTSYAVLHWTRLPRVTGKDGQQGRRARHANLIAMLASEYLIALLLAWTSIVSMFSDQPGNQRLPLAFRVAPFALVIVGTLAVRVIRLVGASDGPPIGDTTPDSCWLFGKLYFNRADPALFVEKRTGLGYTLNLGNPVSWLVIIVAVTALAIPLLLVS